MITVGTSPTATVKTYLSPPKTLGLSANMSRSCSCRVMVCTCPSSSKMKVAEVTPLESTVVIWFCV